MIRSMKVSAQLEDSIVSAMIMHTDFLSKIRKSYRPDYFSAYGKLASKWAVEYFDNYAKAPKHNIETIYSVHCEDLPKTLSNNISTYLAKLSDHYGSADLINVDYLVDRAKKYFKSRAYRIFFEEGHNLMTAGKTNDAVKLLDDFKAITGKVSQWDTVLDKESLIRYFEAVDRDLFRSLVFPGEVGKLIGGVEPGWLICFLGPMKRGKSFWLQDVVFRAAASKKRVCYVNLEMLARGVRGRLYQHVTSCAKEEGLIKVPVFDCLYNKENRCPVPHLRGNESMSERFAKNSKKRTGQPKAQDENLYIPCTTCRSKDQLKSNYRVCVHLKEFNPRTLNEVDTLKSVNNFTRQYGDRIRMITYPAYSITIDEIRSDIRELEWSQGFRPDVVVIDYADIVESGTANKDERDNINKVWKAMKREAADTQTIWATASQATRTAIEKSTVSQMHVSEDIRKLAHVDVMLGINQTAQEKDEFMQRINILAHRHRTFNPNKHVAVLYQYAIGQTCLDSEIWPHT